MPLPCLSLPSWYEPEQAGHLWRVPYQQTEAQARAWAAEHGISPAAQDTLRVALLLIDVQNCFCLPEFELFVGGRSGMGAVEDNRRLCEFIYRHLGRLTEITATLDTHQSLQIFHARFWVDARGEHPAPLTMITSEEIEAGRWRVDPSVAAVEGADPQALHAHARHYARRLEEGGRFALTIWPYHGMLGGVGHALAPAVEQALFVHGIARDCQPRFELKGGNPLTEHYSALAPEVLEDRDGRPIARRNRGLVEALLRFDRIVIAGQAKSHCVAWTVADLLEDFKSRDTSLARRLYLLEDCCSPVVVPGVVDFTDDADAAFQRFADAGAHIVRSGEADAIWEGSGA